MSDSDFLKHVRAMARKKKEEAAQGAAASSGKQQNQLEAPELEPCCEGMVHVAYRGVSDDRMYMSRDRRFEELKYFRPNGLRVFCASCRRRMV